LFYSNEDLLSFIISDFRLLRFKNELSQPKRTKVTQNGNEFGHAVVKDEMQIEFVFNF